MCNVCTRDVQPPAEKPAAPNNIVESMKMKHNITTDPMDPEKQKEVEYQPDLLAVSTQYSKIVFDIITENFARFKETKLYAIATRTTQPFQVALVVVVVLAWLSSSGSRAELRGWKALYVISIATHLGAQIWMTLISGLVLYFTLPRHEFGRVQTTLFPAYYVFNAIVSLLAILAYIRSQSLSRFEKFSWIQLALLLVVFSIEAYVRLGLVAPMLRVKHKKTQMEEAAGGGKEVGVLILGELAHCPVYMRELRKFRAFHTFIVIGTIITLGCSFYSIMILVDSMCL